MTDHSHIDQNTGPTQRGQRDPRTGRSASTNRPFAITGQGRHARRMRDLLRHFVALLSPEQQASEATRARLRMLAFLIVKMEFATDQAENCERVPLAALISATAQIDTLLRELGFGGGRAEYEARGALPLPPTPEQQDAARLAERYAREKKRDPWPTWGEKDARPAVDEKATLKENIEVTGPQRAKDYLDSSAEDSAARAEAEVKQKAEEDEANAKWRQLNYWSRYPVF
jgi:hypothetical protein